jgi:C4-dicarboxylate transporter DctM subunit
LSIRGKEFQYRFAGIGMLTTAVCVGVYTAAGIVKVSPDRAFREIPDFVLIGFIYGVLMILLPNLATWLPRNLF